MSVCIPLDRLMALCNPLQDTPWPCGEVGAERIAQCLAEQDYEQAPVPLDADADRHAARIAWMIVQGWQDPIAIDVGVPEMGAGVEWPVVDGNHRLGAAIWRGDTHILAELSGSIPYLPELFSLTSCEV